ncbi:hypothetical protein C1646_717376 [Rhizophagus diaphanus]|nr:hypothetical protein C1646_717376 [Rhizophagus diaphanus] [Rhizophagus sp. MUCL 43196]
MYFNVISHKKTSALIKMFQCSTSASYRTNFFNNIFPLNYFFLHFHNNFILLHNYILLYNSILFHNFILSLFLSLFSMTFHFFYFFFLNFSNFFCFSFVIHI